MQNLFLSNLGMEITFWKQYRVDDPYIHEKTSTVPCMKRFCYEITHEMKLVTLGVYEYKGEEILKAWGYKDSEHCSYHTIKKDGIWSGVIEGCPDFTVTKNQKGEVIGYNLS